MITLTLTPKELQLLSQAIGEAVAREEDNTTAIERAMVDFANRGGKPGKRLLNASLDRHQALLHLMRKVDGGPV